MLAMGKEAENSCSSNSPGSNVTKLLRREIKKNLTVSDFTVQTGELQQIKNALEVKNDIICKEMHKAMSPISAISGYLELMKMLLEGDSSTETVERYRSKIEEGVNELGEIFEELYETVDASGLDKEKDAGTIKPELTAKTKKRAS